MAKRVNYAQLAQASTQGRQILNNTIKEIIEECDYDDPPYYSDIRANYDNGGSFLNEHLGQLAARNGGRKHKWKVRVLCGEYGEKPKPGDIVRRPTMPEYKNFNTGNTDGIMYGTRTRNASLAAGTYEEDFMEFNEYVLDEKGCFDCEFEDMGYFIGVYGVHGKSGRPLGRTAIGRQFSEEPVRTPDGQMKHVHYWRYTEVDKEQYEALPVLDDNKDTDKPTRTRAKKDKDNAETV